MPDLYGIKQTLDSGATWNKAEPDNGFSVSNGIMTYNQDNEGGDFNFGQGSLLSTATAEISRFEMDLNGIASGDTLDIYIYNGISETLWWSLNPGTHVMLAENAGELILPFGYKILCECTSATTAVTTIDIYATEYANLLNEIRMLHIGNWEVTWTIASSPSGAPRNVGVGSVDYETVKVKDPAAADWSSPVYTYVRYYWYQNVGDTNPIKVGAIS